MLRHTSISKFKITEQLGEGGMGVVYKAFDSSNNRDVALKVLLKHSIYDSEIKHRFTREASAGMRINHPNVIKIFEVGEEEGELFISMEYIEGSTLRQILKNNPPAIPHIIDITISVCNALSEAHKMNIIHRDIKSDNIMISSGGEVKVMDFGLAKVQDASILTREASVLGTVAYMSPQQAIGEAIDNRSDIFSLGVVMYELLTGKMPFTGDYEMAVIYSILNEEPVGLREINEQIPKSLEQVIFKALKKDPRQRYQSTDELAEDLKKVKILLEQNIDSLQETEPELHANEEAGFEEKGFTSALVGREAQFDKLKSELQQVTLGEGRTVFLTGEAGIGKTRLTWEFEKHAKSFKVRMLKSKCLLMKSGYPYQPFIDAIRSFFDIKGIETDYKLKEFISEQAADLTELLPVVAKFLNIKSASSILIERKEQYWDAIYKLILTISKERPLIIFIDDMHWADEDTLSLFYYLSRNISTSKIMMLGTYRPEDIKATDGQTIHPLKQVQYELNRDGLLTLLELYRLKQEEIKALASSIFKGSEFPAEFYDELSKETDGNPFFIMETLKLLKAENIIKKEDDKFILMDQFKLITLPSKVHDIIIRRVERLSESEREILELASVEGEIFHSAMLAECLEVSRIKMLKKLQSLERDHHIIHPFEKNYRFDHAKIKDALYTGISPELRSEYHLLIGDYLLQNYNNDERLAPEISAHMVEGGNKLKAFPFILISAERARAVFANGQAVKYYLLALEIHKEYKNEIENSSEKEIELREGLGDVFRLTGNHKGAIEQYSIVENSEFLSLIKKAELLRKTGAVYLSTGDSERALKYLELAEKEIMKFIDQPEEKIIISTTENNLPHEILGKIKITRSNVYKIKGEYHLAENEINKGLNLLGNNSNYKARAQGFNSLGNIYYDHGSYALAAEMYEKSLELRKEISDKKGIAEAYNNLSNIFYELGDYTKSAEYMEKSLKIMNEIGFRMGIAGTLNNLGTIYQDQGRYKEALAVHKKSLMIREEIGDKPGVALSKANLGFVNIDLRQFNDASEYLKVCLKIMDELEMRIYEPQIRTGFSLSLAEMGDFAEAKRTALKALNIAKELKQKSNIAAALRMLAVIELKKIKLLSLITTNVFIREDIINNLKDSLKIFEDLNMLHEKGRCMVEIARYYKFKKDLSEADKFISNAREIFIQLGAEGDLEKLESIFSEV